MWKAVTLSCVSGAIVLLYVAKKLYSGSTCKCTERLDGKVIVITGGNSGIGKELAIILANRGAKLVLACRNVKGGEQTVKDIITKTGNSDVRCEHLDLADFRSIINFTEAFKGKDNELYALINNAAIFHHPYQLTKDGFELTFQTNYLGPVLLTLLLLDTLKKNTPSKIINVSSEAHRFSKVLDIPRLHLQRAKFDAYIAYGESKLCMHLFTNKLAHLFRGKGITANCVDPGNTRTNIYRTFPLLNELPWYSINRFLYWLQFRSSWYGAQTIVHVLLNPALSNTTGKYFRNCKEVQASDLAYTEELIDLLWDNTVEWLKDEIPRTSSVVFLG